MKKVSLFLLTATIACIVAQAQSPYYFYDNDGRKVYLKLNTEYAFLSVKEPQLPELRGVMADELRYDFPIQRPYKETRRFYTQLVFEENLSDEQYLSRLADMRRQNEGAIISPYFIVTVG